MLAARPPQKPSRLFTEVYGLNLFENTARISLLFLEYAHRTAVGYE